MPLTFNALLRTEGISPADVRLLRHETHRHLLTPYALWRDRPADFDTYQKVQRFSHRAYFASPYWASFVVAPGSKTLFVGLWRVSPAGPIPPDWLDPISGRDATSLQDYELYTILPVAEVAGYAGRLVIEWGAGSRQWRQRAENQDKVILELRESFVEPAFPGYLSFVAQLSDLETLPAGWRTALEAAQGVYLITCPRTREQYVGAAYGSGGFLGRWLEYARTGHGGNVALRERDPANYRVSILQVAGSADGRDAIERAEVLWKEKLQSRDMGLNRN